MNPYAEKRELSSIYGINYSVWFQEGILWFGSINLYGVVRYKLKTGPLTKWMPLYDVQKVINEMHRAVPYDYARIQLYDWQLQEFRKELLEAWLSVIPACRNEEDSEQMKKHIKAVEKRLKAALERYEENV